MTCHSKQLFLTGRIPSKKNSRNNFVRSGRMFNVPSVAYRKWHARAVGQIALQGAMKIIEPIQEVELRFRMPDNRLCDLTNKAESVMDLLVDCHVIADDCWQVVPRVLIIAGGIDRTNPGVDVCITYVGA